MAYLMLPYSIDLLHANNSSLSFSFFYDTKFIFINICIQSATPLMHTPQQWGHFISNELTRLHAVSLPPVFNNSNNFYLFFLPNLQHGIKSKINSLQVNPFQVLPLCFQLKRLSLNCSNEEQRMCNVQYCCHKKLVKTLFHKIKDVIALMELKNKTCNETHHSTECCL